MNDCAIRLLGAPTANSELISSRIWLYFDCKVPQRIHIVVYTIGLSIPQIAKIWKMFIIFTFRTYWWMDEMKYFFKFSILLFTVKLKPQHIKTVPWTSFSAFFYIRTAPATRETLISWPYPLHTRHATGAWKILKRPVIRILVPTFITPITHTQPSILNKICLALEGGEHNQLKYKFIKEQ